MTHGLLLGLLFSALVGPAFAGPLPGAPPLPDELAARLERARSEAGDAPRTRHLDAQGRPLFANRLALEPSPYLLQHAYNPVNWFPWGPEAFAEAKRLNRPVLLSIGYSTCHWCHVMEEQSFEDLEIAEQMNRHYVAIKVDREERPDIDGVYMNAVRTMTGSGGWPMTMWLTHDGSPFYGGTYFPPRDSARSSRPGFLTLLRRIAEAYEADPDKIHAGAADLRERLAGALEPESSVGVPGTADIERALAQYERRFDRVHAGLRSSRKFPGTLPITFLLRAYRRTGEPSLLVMSRETLDAMRKGGIYDHVGGGFHRYTTDRSWTVPHFEKMLYDNALLVLAYVEAWQVTGDPEYEWVARDVLDYIAREMTSAEGSFYSATDADSEGEEGRYFVWDRESMQAALGESRAKLAFAAYGLDGKPNFEGSRWVLRRDASPEELAERLSLPLQRVRAALEDIRTTLRAARAKRVPPLRDDKQVVAWNGLMISAYARAGLAFRQSGLVAHAAAAARALLERGRPARKLARYLKDGAPHGTGLLDDHAFLVAGLLDLFEATGDAAWLAAAISLQAELDERFYDDRAGGYWISPHDGEKLLARQKPIEDGARPSGNAVAASNLLRLYHLTTDEAYRERAEMTLRSFADRIADNPTGYGRMLEALDFMLDTPKEILIITPDERAAAEPFLVALGKTYLPNRVLAVVSEQEIPGLALTVPLLEEKRALRGRVTAYVCEDRVCERPASEPEVFVKQLAKPARPYPGAAP